MRLVGDYTVTAIMRDGQPYLHAVRNGPLPPGWDEQDRIVEQRIPTPDPYSGRGISRGPLGWDHVKKLECVVSAYENGVEAAAQEYKTAPGAVQMLVDMFEKGELS